MGCQLLLYQVEILGSCIAFGGPFQDELGTRVDLSTTFHLQIDGQSEHTIQVLEDILGACVL